MWAMHTYSFLAFAQSPEFKQLPLRFTDGKKGRFLKWTWNTGIKRKLWFSKLKWFYEVENKKKKKKIIFPVFKTNFQGNLFCP